MSNAYDFFPHGDSRHYWYINHFESVIAHGRQWFLLIRAVESHLVTLVSVETIDQWFYS